MNSDAASVDITHLLGAIRAGDRSAFDRLFAIVYSELHRLAHRERRRSANADDATFETTVLVHETYLKLLAARSPDWSDRRHFYHTAAKAMRQIISDHARRTLADKRGGGAPHVSVAMIDAAMASTAQEFLVLDEAIGELARYGERLAQVVELHFYTGLNFKEIGQLLEVSERTIKRDWRLARAFLYQRLGAS